jgi:hypothetical protein
MKRTYEGKGTLTDVLPVQEDYYLLSNGRRYAQHGGSEDETGVLVFPTWEEAEDFRSTVGKGLPEFKTVKVDAETMLDAVEESGALCRSKGLSVLVARIRGGR